VEWDKNWHKDVFINKKGFTKEHYFKTGKTAIARYFERYKPFNDTQILGAEQLVTFKLGGYTIRGFIDRIAKSAKGEYEIHDYKTSSRLPTQEDADADRQLALYQIAMEEMFGGVKKTKLVWHYLVFDQEIVSYRSPAQLKDLKDDTIRLIKTIEGTKEFECRPSGLCGWCDYEHLCPARSHLVKISKLLTNEYLNDSGVKLVSRFGEIKEKIKELNEQVAEKQDELERIKEAAIAYSEKKNEEIIYGKGRCLTVKKEKIIEFPGTKDEGRKELETLIHKLNLWDDVSSLQTRTLAKLVSSGDLDDEIRKKLMKFGEETTGIKVGYKKSGEREEED